jgi:hypothetical protein
MKRRFKWCTQSAVHLFFFQQVKRLGEGQAVNNLVFAVVQEVLLSYYKILWEAEME